MTRRLIFLITRAGIMLWAFALLSLYQGPGLAGGPGGPGLRVARKSARMPVSMFRACLAALGPDRLTGPEFNFTCRGRSYTAVTTIDQDLQSYLDSLMPGALGRFTAIICLDPVSGRILAMSGFDRQMSGLPVWTQKLVPSASLFKIVTASGAIELFNMTPETVFLFNGRKHTLYRYQLKDKKNRYTSRVSLREAFGGSINPVFGKIGTKYLKKEGLLEMAGRFLWGQEIPFELPVRPSTISVTDDSYNWAEVASGFNRDTRVTALHAALIAGAVADSGVMMAPSFIDRIKSSTGQTVYQRHIYPLARPINPKTANMLSEMMRDTVRSGTARRAFRGSSRDVVLRHLVIGGKTGTIDNNSHELRYDWFCGFARERHGVRTMAVAVIVAHEDVLGQRSASYARLAIKRYFSVLEGRGAAMSGSP